MAMKQERYKKQRKLFTDGWNSFWHLFFGIFSIKYQILIPGFIIYQLLDYTDVNLWIDLGEFFIGMLLIYSYTIFQNSRITNYKFI